MLALKCFLARWLTGFAYAADGVCVIATMGLWSPDLGLKADFLWLDLVELRRHAHA